MIVWLFRMVAWNPWILNILFGTKKYEKQEINYTGQPKILATDGKASANSTFAAMDKGNHDRNCKLTWAGCSSLVHL